MPISQSSLPKIAARRRTRRPLVAGLLLSAALPASALADETSGLVEELIVTAERRSANVTETPVTVQVLSADKLDKAGITNIYDIAQVTPGIRMDLLGTNLQPTVRGVTSSTSGTGNSANVVIYVDGYYQPSNLSNNLELADVTSIEVVKGPQGTLFGRNATGGAILVNTMMPSFDTQGKVQVGYGTDNDIRGSGFVTGALTENLAASASLVYRSYDGFTKNILTGKKDGLYDGITLRGKLLYKPTDRLSLLMVGRYSNTKDGAGRVYRVVGPNTTAFFIPGSVVATEKYTNSQDLRPRSDTEVTTFTLTTTYDFDFARLTSYTGYQNEITNQQTDLDGSSAVITNNRTKTNTGTLSQEFVLNSSGEGPLRWTVGANYWANLDAVPYYTGATLANPRPNNQRNAKIYTEAYAVFADGTWEFRPNWFLSAGARFSYEEKSFRSFLTNPQIDAKADFDSITPRINLRYQFDSRSSAYIAYQKGFKSGTFNATATVAAPINPEKIDAFEAGYKIARGRFIWNNAAFFYTYKDLQVASYDFTVAPAVTKLQNAGKAEMYGIDTDLNYALTANLDLVLSASYIHARYKDFPGAIAYVPNASGIGYRTVTIDASGKPMMRQPDFTANAGLTYTWPTEVGEFRLSGNVFYTSRVPSDPGNQYTIDPYALVDLTGGWTSPDDRWTFTVIVKNALDKYYISYWDPVGTALMVADAAPRYVRATLGLKF
ncbi:TonB-dependent receptor [Phenylobacterium sp.]|uniref:TonB-dependent receptor n=1 Tax=Phenylobacterium sp. TaxID=1871053 RepID=UPI00301C0BDE